MAQRKLFIKMVAASGVIAFSAYAAKSDDTALEPVNEQLRLKNFDRAVELLKPLATANHTSAELLLANMYRQGLGVNADTDLAKQWLLRAAEQGNAEAMYELAVLLANLDTPDHELIQQWLARSAKSGFTLANEALRDKLIPLQFQPVGLSDPAARRAAYWLAASQDDVTQLISFNDAGLLSSTDEFGRSALSYAANHGANRAVDWLLRAGADPNQMDSFGITPLMLAAGSDHPAVVNALLNSGAHTNAQDKAGNNALMYAIGQRSSDCISALLATSDIKQRNAQGWSALDWATHGGDNALMARLRSMGLESTRQQVTTTTAPAVPLVRAGNADLYRTWPDVLIASTRSDTRLFDAVLQANSGALRGNESASLLLAVQAGNQTLIDRLLMRGITDSADMPDTSLGWSVRHGKLQIVQKLLSGGIKPDAHGNAEDAPLLSVARQSDAAALDMLDALLKAGANPDVRDRQGRTALMLSARSQQPALVDRLLRSGANSDLLDNTGRSALMYAALNGNERIATLLAAEKVAIDKRDKDGNSALMLAAIGGNANVVETLLAAGANTQNNNTGISVLMLAAAKGQDNVVKKLLGTRIKVDAQDLHGDTALIYAARQGQLATVRVLLAAGANAELRNNDRASAADVAERLAFKDIAAIFAQRS